MIANLRKRRPEDTIKKCRENREIIVAINRRDEWDEDEYYVAPEKLASFIYGSESWENRPFYLD